MTTYFFKKTKQKKYKTKKYGTLTTGEIALMVGMERGTVSQYAKKFGIDEAIEIMMRKSDILRISFNGEQVAISEAIAKTGLSYMTIYKLIKSGVTLDEYIERRKERKPSCGSVNAEIGALRRKSIASDVASDVIATCKARVNSK